MGTATLMTYQEMVHDESYEKIEGCTEPAALAIATSLRKNGLQALTFSRFLLSVRAKNALHKNKLMTVWDALHLSRRHVLALEWCGMKSRHEIYTQVKNEAGITMDNWLDK